MDPVRQGDVLTVSKIAGIMGAKETSRLLPLCHPIPLRFIGMCRQRVSV